MCLILFAIDAHPLYPLVVLSNRDEFFSRPTRVSGFWPEAPDILAGKDLRSGGTWMGITRQGRFAAVTNYRDPSQPDKPRSRGSLVLDYLQSSSPEQTLQETCRQADLYSGFNLLAGTTESVQYVNEISQTVIPVASGVHGLSNGRLDEPWPKVSAGKGALQQYLEDHPNSLEPEALSDLLTDRELADDDQLPDTGVGPVLEKALSSRFVACPATDYGTRASTVLLIRHDGQVIWLERCWSQTGEVESEQRFEFLLDDLHQHEPE